MTVRARFQEHHEVRRRGRRRRRGGAGRGPVALQRVARGGVAVVGALRRGLGHLTAGDRPLVAVLIGAMALSVVLVSGPAQQYLDGSARVETLAAKAEALDAENERLEQRLVDLEDPATVEQLAREQQGFARPGEVPYTLVPPPVDRPVISPPRDGSDPQPTPWFRRMWESISDWLG